MACRDASSSVVLLPNNMSVTAVMKDHWWNPPKVKVRAQTLWDLGGLYYNKCFAFLVLSHILNFAIILINVTLNLFSKCLRTWL